MSNPQIPNGSGRLFAIVSYILPVIGGVVGLAINKDNALTRTHAYQSIGAVLSLIIAFVIWMGAGYFIALLPTVHSIIAVLTYILVAIGGAFFLYRLVSADLIEKVKANAIRKLIWASLFYVVGGSLLYISQSNPEGAAFAVSMSKLLTSTNELWEPVLLLSTLMLLGAGILSTGIMRFLSVVIIINMLAWLPLAVSVISVALFTLVIALGIFLAVNWLISLVTAIQGKERVIPLSNRLVIWVFRETRK